MTLFFAIASELYGYTFVGKGNVPETSPGNRRACLSQTSLSMADYHLDPFTSICHISLMAYVGDAINDNQSSLWKAHVKQTQKEMQDHRSSR